MSRRLSREGPAIALLALFVLGAALLLAGCTGTGTTPGQGTGPAVTTPAVPAYLVHIQGKNHGVILLVGRSTCPWCMKTKELLANMSVDYYWVDLNSLDQANTTQVLGALKVCGKTDSVPILLINGETCIVGFQEAKIREALG